MRIFLLLSVLALSTQSNAAPADSPLVISTSTESEQMEQPVEFPIFGKKKTSNKRQRKFATKRSRRHGKGIMRARKSRGKGKTKGGRGKSKKKEGCNT